MRVQQYKDLIEQEAGHWGSVHPDPHNPQIWDDERLFEIYFGKEYRHLIQRVQSNGSKVLELGCGEGNLAIELTKRYMDVTAIDLSTERIEKARAKSSQLASPTPPHFIVGDLNTLELPHKQFDCIVANGALHHILNLDHLLDESVGALKPSGSLVVLDFIGMAMVRKILAACLYGLLPTYKPYREKLHLRTRLRSFLATEDTRRHALERKDLSALHPESPFEEISQYSIVQKIKDRFRVVELFTFSPFWYYLAPKVRLPKSLRYRAASLFHSMDRLLVQTRIAQGAYVFIEAKKI